jgi:translation initiation factor 1
MADKLVYSSEQGDLRKTGNSPGRKKKKKGNAKNPASIKDGVVRVQRESKGRGGKTVTVIYGLPSGTVLSDLARELKQKSGAGGTVKEGTIVIQGDRVDSIMAFLAGKGFTVKRAGG